MPDNPFLSIKKKKEDTPKTAINSGLNASPGAVQPEKVKTPSQADLILNRSKQKEAYADVKIPGYIQILKISSIALLIISIGLASFLTLDLAEDNKYLGILYDENTRTKFERLNQEQLAIQGEVNQLTRTRDSLEEKLQNNIFSENTEIIESIKDKQITWFDTYDDEGNFHIGLFNMPNHLGAFINERQYDESLGEEKNKVVIENITANRNSLSFNFEASNLYGKVFNLTQEFISFINASPVLEGVSISSFSRSTDEIGWDSMTLGVNAKIQEHGVVEENDDPEVYERFSDWVQSENQRLNRNVSQPSSTNQTVTETQITNPSSPVRLTPR